MGDVQDEPQLAYPAPLEEGRGAAIETNADAPPDMDTPILIVGGGPVGMLQALLLTRLHQQPCILIEREASTTRYPKMEFTNGRSMEIYRKMGLHDSVRAMATKEVAEHHEHNEINVTGLADAGKLIGVWAHDGAATVREKSRAINDGSQYLEPVMRCHQILIEAWLKERIEEETLIQGLWGSAFVGLEEKADHVISVVTKPDGSTIRIRSQYVIGCDGGGSWVRKSVGLESKRKSLELTMAFVHFRSAALRASLSSFPRFWHANVIAAGALVSQNEDDLWTCHFMVPPEVDAQTLTPEQVVGNCIGGCQGQVPVTFDEVLCRGVWKTDVAIADAFTSAKGRVFLAGDAAHQLSPVGGHGLNSGLGDAFDLAWKLSATLRGWAGPKLLSTYDTERRAIAFENLGHVQHGLDTVLMPFFMSHLRYGVEVLNGDGPDGEKARAELAVDSERGAWLHNQNANILGYSYKTSPVIITTGEVGERPRGSDPDPIQQYVPTTWPGGQAPHLWMDDGRSTLDLLSADAFNLIDFSINASLSAPFIEVADNLGVPLQVLKWSGQDHVRKVYERDLVLIRPDTHVAWRVADGVAEALSTEEASVVLKTVTGKVV